MEDLTPKERNGDLNFSESSEKEDQCARRSGRMAQWYEASLFLAGGSWGADSNPGGATSIFFHRIFSLCLVAVYSHC